MIEAGGLDGKDNEVMMEGGNSNPGTPSRGGSLLVRARHNSINKATTALMEGENTMDLIARFDEIVQKSATGRGQDTRW